MIRLRPRSHGRSCARWLAAAVLSLSGGLAACSGEQVLGDYPPSTCDLSELAESLSGLPLTIASFWPADDREAHALQTLVQRVDERRFVVSTKQRPTRIDVQLHIRDAFESRQLPDVFQVNGGSDVLRWVTTPSSESTGVCALDQLRDRYGWSGLYFPSVLSPLSCRDQLFGLPVGVHHLNLLFYNHELYAKLRQAAQDRGLELVEPSKLGSVHELVAQLKLIDELGLISTNGVRVVPLALGTSKDWPLTILAFENVLLSLGRDAYQMLWQGGLAGDNGERALQLEAVVREMLDVLRAIGRYSDFPARVTWQEAMRQVGDGAAVMTVTGDWGWAQLSAEQRERVATISYPGTAGSFVYTPDSFSVPRELGKNGFPARSFLLDVVSDKDALIEFANAKHAIPPRSDLAPHEIAALGTESMQRTYREFQDCDRGGCQLLLAVSGLAPPPGVDPCFDDIEALLTLAVAESAPSAERLAERRCPAPFPGSSAEADERLVELLLHVAEQRFASNCR